MRITVTAEIQESLRQALTEAGKRECGGILMGEHVGVNHFAVRFLTVQKTGTFASFVRSLSSTIKALKAFFKTKNNNYTRFNYLGEWHSHPSFSVLPSEKDHATMRGICMDDRVGANFVVLLIFRLQRGELEGSAHTYLPDGSVHNSILDLERTQ